MGASWPTATPWSALVVSPQPGPPPLVSASRARFMAPVERGAQILTMVTMVMVSVSALPTTVATPRLTLTGLPKASAFVMASTTARGALTLLPTTPTAWSSPTTTTSTLASPATTTPPACLDVPLLLSPTLARERPSPQLMLRLRPRLTLIMATMDTAGGSATVDTTVDIMVAF